MFSSRAFPRLARVLRSTRAFTAVAPVKASQTWRWQATLGLLAGGVLVSTDWRKTLAADPVADVVVCKLSDLTPGVPKQIQVGENKENYIVVAKVGAQVYAVSGKCPHFGAPLANGYLDGYHLFCPWHAAAFDIRSGEIYGAPTVNSLTSYRTRVTASGDVVVSIPEANLAHVSNSRPSPRLAKPDGSDPRTFVVIGGGGAGHACVETLRKNNFKGRIILLSEDTALPYDRVLLSKNVKGDAAGFVFRGAEFYEEFGIEVKLATVVNGVDEKKKIVKTASGEEIKYDKLCLATGARARIPGIFSAAVRNLKGVHTIRSAKDHTALRASLAQAKNVVIIGGSFLGLETATAVRRAYPEMKVTVVDVEENAMDKAFGSAIARQLTDLQKKNGVSLRTGIKIVSINEQDGHAKSVTIEIKSEFKSSKEDEIEADVVVVATGATLNTEYVPHLLLNQDKSVRVDAFLQTDDPHIFAAGDIASYHSYLTQTPQRVEHWAVAQDQGRIAAENMLGLGQVFGIVPFFWTNQFGNAQFAGYSKGADWSFTETDSEDEPSKTARITYFYKGEKCVGVATINKPGAVLRLRIALARGLMPSREELTRGKVRYASIAARVDETNGGKWGPRCQRQGCCQDRKK